RPSALSYYVLVSVSHPFSFNATATPQLYTLSLHDALPISPRSHVHEYALPHLRVPLLLDHHRDRPGPEEDPLPAENPAPARGDGIPRLLRHRDHDAVLTDRVGVLQQVRGPLDRHPGLRPVRRRWHRLGTGRDPDLARDGRVDVPVVA